MARKANLGSVRARAAPDRTKGALSLAMRRWLRFSVLCLVIFLAAILNARFAFAESPESAANLLARVNQTRAEAGFSPLQLNAKLSRAAAAQARHLAESARLSHLGPNDETLGERLQSAEYDYAETAENLASGSADPVRIVSLWRASLGHRRIMLNPAYSEAGIGHVTMHDIDYWTLILAHPR